jgi:hypothetical protein
MVTGYHHLPRDVTLKILSKLDIDTRVKLGLVFKLKIPQQVANEISRCLQVPSTYPDIDDCWFIKLGPCVFPNRDDYTTYSLQHYHAFDSMVYLTTHAIREVGTINYSTHDSDDSDNMI